MLKSGGVSDPFVRFCPYGDRAERERLAAFVEASVSGALRGDEIGELPASWRPFAETLSARPYASLCTEAPELAAKFTEEAEAAIARAYRDLAAADPAADFAALVEASGDCDLRGLAAILEAAGAYDDPASSRLDYYAGRLAAAIEGGGSLGDAERERGFREKALEEVAELLGRYREEFGRRFLSEGADRYLSELDGKYAAMRSILSGTKALSSYLGRFWDLSAGEWAVSDWASLAAYAELLEGNPALVELAESLGRLKDAEDEYLEELASAAPKSAWRPTGAGKSEIVGVRFSDDLSSLLPAEAGLLASEDTELVFLKRFAEKSLLTLDYSAAARYEEPEPPTVSELKPRRRKGPILLLADTSGSMHGTPETIAKTVALAVLKVALREGRRCELVSFSTEFRAVDLCAVGKGMKAAVDFLSRSFHGGTDLEPPLRYALDRLMENDWAGADVLVVSDFEMPRPSDRVVADMEGLRGTGTRFYGLLIGPNAHYEALSIFDSAWVHDPLRGIGKADVAALRSIGRGR